MDIKQSRPTIHDWLSLFVLRAAKSQRFKYTNSDDASFYNQFFRDEHVESYYEDVRAVLRRQQIQTCLDQLLPSGILLDAGCGIGNVLKSINGNFKRIGLEFSLNSLYYAQSMYYKTSLNSK
jgi:SAM-dependent methyltransferase